MIDTAAAFAKFKTRLELSQKEQQDASRRHLAIREFLKTKFSSETDFLTGSYGRNTKTKPLKDVDVFFVLSGSELSIREEPSTHALDKFRTTLSTKYDPTKVTLGRRAVKIDFGIQAIDDTTDEQIMSIDVVPAFSEKSYYEIPDRFSGSWIKTNPERHSELATDANKDFSGEWKPLVKMIKKWNSIAGKPIKPSFLIEVMALSLFVPPFSGGYPYELKGFFADCANKIGNTWDDPSGLGTPVSDRMTETDVLNARGKLENAQKLVNQAILAEKQGRQGDSLSHWRELFGPLFPLS